MKVYTAEETALFKTKRRIITNEFKRRLKGRGRPVERTYPKGTPLYKQGLTRPGSAGEHYPSAMVKTLDGNFEIPYQVGRNKYKGRLTLNKFQQ